MLDFLARSHTFIIHFAVALPLTGLLFDILGLFSPRKEFATTGFSLHIAGIAFLILAVLTGNLAVRAIYMPDASALIDSHQSFATIGVLLFCGGFIWRLSLLLKRAYTGARKFFCLLLITAAAVLIFMAAERGGRIHHGETRSSPAISLQY